MTETDLKPTPLPIKQSVDWAGLALAVVADGPILVGPLTAAQLNSANVCMGRYGVSVRQHKVGGVVVGYLLEVGV